MHIFPITTFFLLSFFITTFFLLSFPINNLLPPILFYNNLCSSFPFLLQPSSSTSNHCLICFFTLICCFTYSPTDTKLTSQSPYKLQFNIEVSVDECVGGLEKVWKLCVGCLPVIDWHAITNAKC